MTREEIVKLGNEAIAKAKNDPEFKKLLLIYRQIMHMQYLVQKK